VTREVKLSAAGLLWLAVFALLYTIGARLDLWPTPAALGTKWRDADLWAGLAFGVLLLAALVAGGSREPLR
jgi:hypothetical protein